MTTLRLTPAATTHRGMRRRNNEDAIGYEYPSDVEILKSHGALFVVADGVGGLSAGDEASQRTVAELIKIYYETDEAQSIEERLTDAVELVNTTIFQMMNQSGATTLIACVIHSDQLIVVSVGDSQAFHIYNGAIAQINDEDVVQSDGEDNGALTKAIGYREVITVEPIRLTIEPSTQILLCSDGLTRYLDGEQLIRLAKLRDPRDSVRRMVNQANAAGGADNISVILINVGDPIETADIATHIANISVRVAVDTDPLMMQDVPSKPTTQIPMARPVSSIDEDLLENVTPKQKPVTGRIEQVTPPQKESNNNTLVILIIIGIAFLLIGGVIFGIAFASWNNNSSVSPAVDFQDSDASIGTIETDNISTQGLQENTIILLENTVMTKNGVDSDVDAFLALIDTPYLIQTITQNSEGHTWYRLVDNNTNQTGWLSEDTLPTYQVQPDS
ncbi:MAG: protein phosphatase 2C domain-containing protein [Chloroflexota bacterium]